MGEIEVDARIMNKQLSYPAYRRYVGWPEGWDILSTLQFRSLTYLGLREHHYLLDIGCGSLRTGRLLIPYLLKGHYFGIEPEKWLIDEGIKNECGRSMCDIKKPTFNFNRDFVCDNFGVKFDFVLAHSIFTHASLSQIGVCIKEVRKCMSRDCIFVASFLEGVDDYMGDSWVYPDCVAYKHETLRNVIEHSGLLCNLVNWSHRNQSLLLITLPEAMVDIPKEIPK